MSELSSPLRPRPKLFIFLLAIFVAWVIFLLVLYFKTVYPMRHATTQASASRAFPAGMAIRPGASGLPIAPRKSIA